MNNKIIIIKLSEVEPQELQDYFKKMSGEAACSPEFNFIGDLCKIYPNIEEWFQNKVKKELEEKKGSREILLVLNGNIHPIVGIAILKKSENEKKICTIRVHKKFLKRGIGSKLFEESIKFLEEPKPMITISEDTIDAFKPLLKKFNFKLFEEKMGLYVPGKKEYIYNKKFEESEE